MGLNIRQQKASESVNRNKLALKAQFPLRCTFHLMCWEGQLAKLNDWRLGSFHTLKLNKQMHFKVPSIIEKRPYPKIYWSLLLWVIKEF